MPPGSPSTNSSSISETGNARSSARISPWSIASSTTLPSCRARRRLVRVMSVSKTCRRMPWPAIRCSTVWNGPGCAHRPFRPRFGNGPLKLVANRYRRPRRLALLDALDVPVADPPHPQHKVVGDEVEVVGVVVGADQPPGLCAFDRQRPQLRVGAQTGDVIRRHGQRQFYFLLRDPGFLTVLCGFRRRRCVPTAFVAFAGHAVRPVLWGRCTPATRRFALRSSPNHRCGDKSRGLRSETPP